VSNAQPGRWLAIDTSSRRGSLSILWDGSLAHGQLLDSKAHASDLLPELDRLLGSVGAAHRAGCLPLTHVIVGTGPGSYTGLRIGIATARSLAWACGAQLLGIPSFEALAHAALGEGQRIAIAQDARAGKFYYSAYERIDEELVQRAAPQLLAAPELKRALGDESCILAEEALLQKAELPADWVARFQSDAFPSSQALLELGQARIRAKRLTDPVEPLYLRAFGEA